MTMIDVYENQKKKKKEKCGRVFYYPTSVIIHAFHSTKFHNREGGNVALDSL